jgi:BlaI family penicillinase repressor
LAAAKLSKLEFQLMQVLWSLGECSIRDMHQGLSDKRRPAYTTVQTTVNRMEAKGILKRVGLVGISHIYKPLITRDNAQRTLIEDLLAMFDDRPQPVMAHLIESGKLSMDDVKEAEKALRKLSKGGKQ